MKSYLSLIPISARVRRRQNRMTLLCIVIAVFLVTAIFSVADSVLQIQDDRMEGKHGRWHLELSGISQQTADAIAARQDVTAVGAMAVLNQDGSLPYRLQGKRAALYGMDEAYFSMNTEGTLEGYFPQKADEILLGRNAAEVLEVSVGDTVTLHGPAGDRQYVVSGLGGVDESYYGGQYFLMDAYLTRDAFAELLAQDPANTPPTAYYVQFTGARQAAKAEPELMAQYDIPADAITENTALMLLAGQSSGRSAVTLYGMAAVLFVLVLLAGVLMISGSMNSSLAQRTQFFGMMRCIGMSKAQIIHFVRLEALNWCKTAVPLGALLGTLTSWGICGVLRYGIGGEFATAPVFRVSIVGLGCGAAVGIVTVLLAAEAPARRAARVSPAAAVSGSGTAAAPCRGAKLGHGKIEVSLGIRHATAGKKGLLLMTASFALSIVLALCFSVLLQFVGLLLPSQAPWSPDVLLTGYANAQLLPRSMEDTLRTIPGVAQVWGATGLQDTPAACPRADIDHVTLVCYDDALMHQSESLVAGGRMPDLTGTDGEVVTLYGRDNPLRVGDTITVRGAELTIVGAFSQGMFSDDAVVICPQALFDRLMGTQDYSMLGVQLDASAGKDTVLQIARLASDDIIVTDERESAAQDSATYLAFRVVAYGFLAIIGLISLFNIVNSISMSVSARTKQYGVMRALGMESRQLTRMIAAEAYAYAVSGLVTGCVAGLWLERMLYTRLITRYFGIAWQLPWALLLALALFVLAAAALAVYAPARRICRMPITAVVGEL